MSRQFLIQSTWISQQTLLAYWRVNGPRERSGPGGIIPFSSLLTLEEPQAPQKEGNEKVEAKA